MNDHDHPHHRLDFDSPQMADLAELEGEVLSGLVAQAIAVLAAHCERQGVEVRRLLDIGCGPGVGTCRLAEHFAAASVVAVDGSATMLEHVTARAARLGLGQRVESRLVELPAGLATLGRSDVAWASMVLHHVGDEEAALRRIGELLVPTGLLALVEHAGPVRVLPPDTDLGRPGIWERLDAAWAAWFADMRAALPGTTTSAEYPAMLQRAGFEVLADELLTLDLDAPLDAGARRFAHRQVLHARGQLGSYGSAADLEALEVLLDEQGEQGIVHRDDAIVHATRRLYVVRVAPRGTAGP